MSGSIHAQEKPWSAGLRLGFGGGVSLAKQVNESVQIEGIATPRWGGLILTGMFIKQFDLDQKNLKWTLGGGMHIGYHRRDNFIHEDQTNEDSYINLGIDFSIGLLYRPADWPIELALDYKPAIDFVATRNLMLEGLGLSLRYRFDI
jgi:hypothetical protein